MAAETRRTRKTSRTRPPVKQRQIMEQLRGQILSGDLAPGGQLPTRSVLEEHYGVSTITIQRALDALGEQGFVEARGRQGTFVVDHPPHLSRYALVFPHRDSLQSPWPRFWTALEGEAQRRVARSPERQVSSYYLDELSADCADFQRLVRDARNRRLAGVFFCFSPHWLAGTRVMTDPSLPRVALRGEHAVAGVTALELDGASFIDAALDHLQAMGRRRIAMVTAPGVHTHAHEQERFRAQLAQRGMETRPYWLQAVAATAPAWAEPCVHLLMNRNQHERPDGLIVANDNLVEYASAGLVAAGAAVPEELSIVGHCNFPWPTPSVLPMRRLGYDAREVFEAALRCLDQQRQGAEPAASDRIICARFEDQLASPRPASTMMFTASPSVVSKEQSDESV